MGWFSRNVGFNNKVYHESPLYTEFSEMSTLLPTVTFSEKRKNLLILLRDGPLGWDEIKIRLDVTASGMLPQIKILEEQGLIRKENKEYSLTEIGYLVVHYLSPLSRTLAVLDRHKKFWQEHDLNAIPREFLYRIGDLDNPWIIETSVEESFEPHKQFLEIILRSSSVFGISPIVHPIYPQFFLTLAREGRKVGLILTESAFQKIKKEYADMLLEGLRYPGSSLAICRDDFRLAFVVTDKYFSLSLFLKNGIFDSKRDIVTDAPSGIMYGQDLYAFYLQRSRLVTPDGSY